MRVSATIFLTDVSLGVVEIAKAIEDAGLDGLYLPEHTHIPSARKTPAPMGEPLPEEYRRCIDPFVALAAAASVTTDIRLGTGICLVAQRDPIVTAKAVATLDQVSNGRFTFGVGFGWNVEEIEHHGVPFSQRRAIGREHLLAMQRLWADDEAEFEGEHVRLSPSWAWPKPVQKPRPPILIGGGPGPKTFALIAELADGWIPIGGRGVRDALPQLRAAMAEVGRDPASLQILPFGSIPSVEKLEYFQTLGIAEVVALLPSGPRDEVMPVLHEVARVASQFRA